LSEIIASNDNTFQNYINTNYNDISNLNANDKIISALVYYSN